jgi:hypothetical protein
MNARYTVAVIPNGYVDHYAVLDTVTGRRVGGYYARFDMAAYDAALLNGRRSQS